MKMYKGSKLINATPMTRQEYNDFRGWVLPQDEDGSDCGYLVEYIGCGKPNTTAYKGYISWSPKDVFDNEYKLCDSFSDRLSIELLELEEKIAKLTKFIKSPGFRDVTKENRELLERQCDFMVEYSRILSIRIVILPDTRTL